MPRQSDQQGREGVLGFRQGAQYTWHLPFTVNTTAKHKFEVSHTEPQKPRSMPTKECGGRWGMGVQFLRNEAVGLPCPTPQTWGLASTFDRHHAG